jgi:hypothetical protein
MQVTVGLPVPATAVVMVPAVPAFPPFMINGIPYPETPIKAFMGLENVFVSQKPQWLEAAGCQFENKYSVYGNNFKTAEVKKDKHNKLFKCKEHSTCCQRYFIPYQ